MARKRKIGHYCEAHTVVVHTDGEPSSYTHQLLPPSTTVVRSRGTWSSTASVSIGRSTSRLDATQAREGTDILRHTAFTSNVENVKLRTSFVSAKAPAFTAQAVCGDHHPTTQCEDVHTSPDVFPAEAPSLEELDQQYVNEVSKEKREAATMGDDPLGDWTPERDEFIRELVRLEGRGDYSSEQCARCHVNQAVIRCEDCTDLAMYCESCTISLYKPLPLHRIQRWVGSHFTWESLKSLGLRIQLGHPVGASCPMPCRATGDDFIILHTTGIHEVGLDFCGCARAQTNAVQLLRARLFPATCVNPKTSATFGLCSMGHLLATQSKTSGYELYRTLARLTENLGVCPPKDRYPSFMRIMRMWRHLKMMKRAGRGHDAGGVEATPEGACTVICPACPHPGINLPKGWEKTPEHEQWKYRLFVGLDANFRLKRKKVSSDAKDPGLNHGCAYFVEEVRFKNFLRKYSDIILEEQSTCYNHEAVKLARMRGSVAGLAASGVAALTCTRHDMRRPCSVADLQKGERYLNMDYVFFESLSKHATPNVVISYDIACQWSRNLSMRHLSYAECPMQLSNHALVYLIPKFHIYAHRDACQTGYSFNFTRFVGESDGEGVERPWRDSNAYATSTKEMGPGARRDFLDDAFSDYNWRKICGMPELFFRRLEGALLERHDQVTAFADLHSAMLPESVKEWKVAIEAWELDPQHVNPFVKTRPVVTQSTVRFDLAKQDAEELARGEALMLHEKVSASMMIIVGLEIQEEQDKVRQEQKELGPHSTDRQRAAVMEKRNTLHRQLEGWKTGQQLYIPAVSLVRSRAARDAKLEPSTEDEVLYLPSELPEGTPCDSRLLLYEWRLRVAQATDALELVRRELRVRTHLYKFKDAFMRGQRENTRSKTAIQRVQNRINKQAARYRRAFTACKVLAQRLKLPTWPVELLPLEDGDVRAMSDGQGHVDPKTGRRPEGQRKISWIWKVHGVGAEAEKDGGLQEELRVEWCKARARAMRWIEEVQLLPVEMRRTVMTHERMAQLWLGRVSAAPISLDYGAAAQLEGSDAYAYRQAEVRQKLATHCKKVWAKAGSLIAAADVSLAKNLPPDFQGVQASTTTKVDAATPRNS